MQGFARVSGKVARGATLWQCAPLPQNRDVWGTTSGGGSLHVFTYHYPDQRCAPLRRLLVHACGAIL